MRARKIAGRTKRDYSADLPDAMHTIGAHCAQDGDGWTSARKRHRAAVRPRYAGSIGAVDPGRCTYVGGSSWARILHHARRWRIRAGRLHAATIVSSLTKKLAEAVTWPMDFAFPDAISDLAVYRIPSGIQRAHAPIRHAALPLLDSHLPRLETTYR